MVKKSKTRKSRRTSNERLSSRRNRKKVYRRASKEIDRLKLIDLLAENLTVNDVYEVLIKLNKEKLAKEFKNEIEIINKKYDELIERLDNSSGKRNNSLKENIINDIIDYLRGLYKYDIKASNEIEFQKEIKAFLIGAMEGLNKRLREFGINSEIEREYKLPSGRRVDLMIKIGKIRIGVEVKMSISKTNIAQRLYGQIDEYIDYCDFLIVLSYQEIDRREFVNKILQKAEEKGKEIIVIDKYNLYQS